MTRALVALVALVGLAAPAAAQDAAIRDALRWPDGRQVADVSSTALVVAAVVTPCLLDRSWHCVALEAARVGPAIVLVEVVKRLAPRTRPNGRDRHSFYSEHTTIACAAVLRTRLWALCPSVAYLRVATDDHWASDTAVGAGVAAVLTVAITW